MARGGIKLTFCKAIFQDFKFAKDSNRITSFENNFIEMKSFEDDGI